MKLFTTEGQRIVHTLPTHPLLVNSVQGIKDYVELGEQLANIHTTFPDTKKKDRFQ